MTIEERDAYLKAGFTPDQVNEIQEGRESGLDTSVYAKKQFLAIQMRQIRLGQMEALPVEKFASPQYDWFQMEEIRLGLRDDLDISGYAKPGISYDRMRQIRLGLKEGINLTRYVRLDAGILRELRKALHSKIAIVNYIKKGYNAEQLELIRIAKEKGLDIDPYLRKELRGASIHEILKGLEEGLYVSVYAKMEYGWRQMREIRLGMENRIDINRYANPRFDWQQMREIRLGLENGIDVSGYCSLMWAASDMHAMRLELEKIPAMGSGDISLERFQTFALTLSGDEMEAYLFLPDISRVTKKQIMETLHQQGIRRGILKEEIDKLFTQGGHQEEKATLIAVGKPATEGRDGWYEYFFRTELNRQPKLLPDGSVDFHSVEWFEMVREGQRIAFYHGAEMGTPGYTVTGKPVPARKGREKSLLTGKGFKLLEDNKTYISTLNGKIEILGQRIEITKMLMAHEVNLATGNVNFDGSVYVTGNVGAGTLIQATGDIVVNGYVEAASIESKGSVMLRQGLNGNGVGYIMADGDVEGKFFESCKIYSRGNIRCGHCLNCDLHAEEKIFVNGKSGMLAGGVAYARKGMDLQFAGNHVGLATHLKLGLDKAFSEQRSEVDTRIAEARKQLSIFTNAYRDFQRRYPPEIRNTMEMYLKIESAVYTKEQELVALGQEKSKLESDMKEMQDVEVKIRGTLYEGTQIKINGKNWFARQVSNVRIKKKGDRITIVTGAGQ